MGYLRRSGEPVAEDFIRVTAVCDSKSGNRVNSKGVRRASGVADSLGWVR